MNQVIALDKGTITLPKEDDNLHPQLKPPPNSPQ